jgi:hypothetical protein
LATVEGGKEAGRGRVEVFAEAIVVDPREAIKRLLAT